MSKNIYLVVGPSGSGKTTVVNEICRRYGYTSVNSFTTRERRFPNEQGHLFVSKEKFDELRPKLCAYTMFDGNEYGATSKQVNKHAFYVIDEAGISYFTAHYMGGKQPVVIYIDSDEDAVKARMKARGDSDIDIASRTEVDRNRKGIAKKFSNKLPTFYIKNDDLEQTIEVVANFVNIREGVTR